MVIEISKKKISTLFNSLWPLNRTLASEDSRKSHKILKKINGFKIAEFKSNKKVFDWIVPKEWNILEAHISDLKGKKVIDYSKNNLHVLNYSSEMNKIMSFSKLKKHLHYNKKLPNAIPYITSYYKRQWGFCISANQLKKFKDKKYKVVIKHKKVKRNSMTVSSILIKGQSKREIILQSYLCHPSMAVNELVGPIIISYLSKFIQNLSDRYYSYRLILAPETIGTIAYLSKYEKIIKKNFLAGYIITCFGKSEKYYYKKSKKNSISNKLSLEFFTKKNISILDYNPFGSDERQYNSEGLNLPVGCYMSEIPGKFKEYHSSLDNKKSINIKQIKKNITDFCKFIKFIESKRYYTWTKNKCEPFISKYFKFYGTKNNLNTIPNYYTLCTKWLIHFCDGNHTLQEISKKSTISISKLSKIKDLLLKKGLLKKL
jgi:aminopeptidase-like protein